MENGNILYLPLYKVIWTISARELPFPAQVAFSVPKRFFRLSVTRNLLKRRMREAYRRHKYILYDFLNSQNIRIEFVVILKDIPVPDYRLVEKYMLEMIGKLTTEAGKTNNNVKV